MRRCVCGPTHRNACGSPLFPDYHLLKSSHCLTAMPPGKNAPLGTEHLEISGRRKQRQRDPKPAPSTTFFMFVFMVFNDALFAPHPWAVPSKHLRKAEKNKYPEIFLKSHPERSLAQKSWHPREVHSPYPVVWLTPDIHVFPKVWQPLL